MLLFSFGKDQSIDPLVSPPIFSQHLNMSPQNSKSSTILILGAGSHARAVAELAADCGYPSVL